MPLTTSSQRRSSVGIWQPWQVAPPSPTDSPGAVDTADRYHSAGGYSGILAGIPPVTLLAEPGALVVTGVDATFSITPALVFEPWEPVGAVAFLEAEITMDPIEICNEALGELGHGPIFSFDDGSAVSTLCAMHFPSARDQVMEMHPWNWTTRRVWLPRLADDPPFGWTYQYMLPPDYIKARGTDQDEHYFGPPAYDIELNAEGNRVLVSNEARVGLVYTCRVDNLNIWSPLAIQMMIKVMASRLAKAMTGQQNLAESKLKEAMLLLGAGARSDGREGTPSVVRIPPRILAVRRSRTGIR